MPVCSRKTCTQLAGALRCRKGGKCAHASDRSSKGQNCIHWTFGVILHALTFDSLRQRGFETRYDFVYLPFDFGRNANLGYAFVNLVHPDTRLL